MQKISPPLMLTVLSALSLGTTSLRAQTPPADPTSQQADDAIIELSPFVITASEDKDGYQANATVAGTRVRTDLKDIASSIQVVTSQFLRDTQAKDNQTLLQFTTNTEVGGIYGNFAGVGNTFVDGAGENVNNLLRPNGNTRVRGLDSADNTRDLFKTDIPWGSFNVGRIDFQRGPNSILYALGSPAGIINASTNTAGFKTEGRVESQLGSFGSKRFTGDYTYVLIPNQLSVRIDAQDDYQLYRQKPAYNRDRRIFGAVRWDPQFFGKDSSARTSLRANFETGTVEANRPRSLPPIDRITPFFDANKINKTLIDPYYDYVRGAFPWTNPGVLAKNYWLSGNTGYNFGKSPTLYYNNTATPISAAQGSPYNYYSIDHQNNGFPYSSAAGIGTYADYAKNLQQYGAANGVSSEVLATVAGAQAGFYKATSLTDDSIFDFYNTLIDGPTKKEWQGWHAYNVSLEQSFFHNRLAFQAVYDWQSYHDGSENNLGWQPYISVDIMKNTMQYPWAYTDLVTANPNAGRAYTGGGNGGNGSRATERENMLVTATGVLKATDFLSKSMLTSILGHHTITGVYSSEQYDVEDRSWVRYAATTTWSDLIGTGYNTGGDGTGGLRSGDVVLGNVVYLSDSLINAGSASGLDLPGIKQEFSPSGSLAVKYYDGHWKWPTDPTAPGYVNPTAPWTNPTSYPTPTDSTQASNPYNYVGWKDTTVTILNADKGDIDQLYTSASKLRTKTSSIGGTWQAYLWDDTIVGTIGVRRDRQKQRGGSAPQDKTGLASMDYGLDPQKPDGITSGTSTSWGLVAHLPQAIRKNLPWDSDISLSFSNGNNTRVENRYGFNAKALPNAKGNTKDISLMVNTFNDKLTVKVTRYKTTVKDANISSVNSQTATLGSNTGVLMNVEAWGTASAMMCQAGIDGKFPGWEWYWNWATIKNNWDGAYNDPTGTAFLNDPETAKEKAAIKSWQDQMLPQSWFDAFGYPINVAKVKAGDWGSAISDGAWQPASYLGSVQASGAGKVNGSYPTGTVDNRSEGWEFEVTGRPIKGLDISFNASKQTAKQIALGADLTNFVESEYAKLQSPAGDLRVWWGGDITFREMFVRDVWAAYLFQKETNGKMVAEMAPWRCNLTANYDIGRGWFKDVNVGASYRWQKGSILGYALNAAQDNLDINKPYWSKNKDWVDLWVGYNIKLSKKIGWRMQVNLRNVGQKPHLTPISVQPDGTPAQYRIEEGLTWQLTNTLTF